MKIKDVIIDMHQGINTVADKVEYLDSGIPIIQSKNFTKGYLDLKDVRYVGKKDEKKYIEKYNPQVGDILMANIGTIGKSYVVSEKQRFLIAWNVFLIKPNAEKVKTEFLKFYFDYLISINYFDTLLTGGTVKFINKKKIGNIIVPDRTIVEQKEICERLLKVEKILIKREEQLKLLDNLIQARFVEMFGDPIRNTQNRPTTKLINIVKMQRGFDLPVQDRNQDGNIPVYGANGVLDNHNIARIYGGGVITGRSGTIGKVFYTEGDYWPLNTTLFSVDKHGNNVIYLAYLLQMFDLTRFVEGTGVPTLNRNMFHNRQIIDVSIDEQNQFATFVQQINKSKFEVQKSLEKTQLLFDSLMQEYFG